MEVSGIDVKIPIGLQFSILHRAFRKKLDEQLREKDLTGVQFGVMGELMRLERVASGEVNQKDLENASHVTHPTMTEIIKRLEKKGFITCETSAVDRRYKSISSTGKALSLRQEMNEVDKSVFQWLSQGLSQPQIDELMEIMDIMLKNAAECCGKGSENCGDKNTCKEHKGV